MEALAYWLALWRGSVNLVHDRAPDREHRHSERRQAGLRECAGGAECPDRGERGAGGSGAVSADREEEADPGGGEAGSGGGVEVPNLPR